MSIETNLIGRLRNTSLPYSNGLLPLFEAIVNSIHAIEEAKVPADQGQIQVTIDRAPVNLDLQLDGKKKPGREALGQIVGFKVTDNGIGFNDFIMKAFNTLDTDYKVNMGGRGIGRLLWLKAFDKAYIHSQFRDHVGVYKRRTFTFDASGVRDELTEELKEGDTAKTTVSLIGFGERYRIAAYKSAETIANAILEHCLWYFLRPGGMPRIMVVDGSEEVNLHLLYENHMYSDAVEEKVEIRNKTFELLHVKLRAASTFDHAIMYCADSRLVDEEKLSGNIPGLFGRLSDDAGEFTYRCYVSSEFLNERVRPERTGFNLVKDLGDLFAETEISQSELQLEVRKRAAAHLDAHLESKRQQGRERAVAFAASKAPRYRPILARIPDDALYIDPAITDKDLDLLLHKHLADFERQLLSDGHDLMKPNQNEEKDEYRARLEKYLAEANEMKQSDLADYVSHRKVILDLFEVALERKPDGKYHREDVLHSFIMPMRKDSSEVSFDDCNLWLVDERLAFHDYLASDKPLSTMPITGSTSTKEPDIVALNVFDNPMLVSENSTSLAASLVVVEIKRPMRDNAGSGEADDPVEQALRYLDRIRIGKVLTAKGRPIPNSEQIPGYCYVICDLTATIRDRCYKIHGMTPTCDGLGYFRYNEPMKAYIQVISFDGLVQAAKERNRAFFDRLGLPAT